MTLRPILLAAAFAGLSAAAHADTRSFAATGFDKVSSGGSWDVVIATGKAASVRAEGDKAMLDRLEVVVEDGTLKIRRERDWKDGWDWRNKGKTTVYVTMPSIRAAAVAGSGNMRVDRAKAASFSASVAGSGNLDIAALDSTDANFSVAGSGNAKVAGTCGTATMSVAGSGNLVAGQLACKTLTAKVAGSGNVVARATATASVSVVGSGDVTVAGGARCSVKKAGSGRVRCDNVDVS